MDILPTELVRPIIFALKIVFILSAGIILAVSYFHTKEAVKMENKLNIHLPGSVHVVLSVQLALSVIFLGITLIFLLFL